MRLVAYLVAGLATLATGCSSEYRQKEIAVPSTKLLMGRSVAIATPENGSYSTTEYTASGKMTALAVRAAFAKFTNSITVFTEYKDLRSLKEKAPSGFDYYVVPEIVHWEDRATEWSGLPDQIQITLSMFEGETWRELASVSIWGKSKWATLGGDHPQDLLPEPINKYVTSLYEPASVETHSP
jgi:hypothetical protein